MIVRSLFVVLMGVISGEAKSEVLQSYSLGDGRIVSTLETFKECELCPEMVALPIGSFLMGARIGESRNPFDIFGEGGTLRRRGPDEINVIPPEHPRHRVEIDIPIAMGLNEVTHAEWMACVVANGCTHTPDHRVRGPQGYTELGPNHPVINVSYDDMLEYIVWLNTLVGSDVYRLPTEAEWEYAARAGTETRFAQGNDLTADQANFSRAGTEQIRGMEMPDLENRRLSVRVYALDAAKAWGLRHMSGNVRECVVSCWSEEHLGLATSSAYLTVALATPVCERVSKGGSFTGGMDYLRLAARGRADQSYRRDNQGFRLVREISASQVE